MYMTNVIKQYEFCHEKEVTEDTLKVLAKMVFYMCKEVLVI